MAEATLWTQRATWQVIGYAMAAGTFVGLLIGWGLFAGLSKSDWASWVQAVGSVAAILLALWVGHRDSRLRDREGQKKRADTIAFALDLVDYAQHIAAETYLNVHKWPRGLPLRIDMDRLRRTQDMLQLGINAGQMGTLTPLLRAHNSLTNLATLVDPCNGFVLSGPTASQLIDAEQMIADGFKKAHGDLKKLSVNTG